MRMHYIILAGAVFLCGINLIAALERSNTHPKITDPINSASGVVNTKRLLRSFNAANVDGNDDAEERLAVEGLSKLAQLDKKTWAFSKFEAKLGNKMWLKAGFGPKYVFNALKFSKAKEKIGDTKEIIWWFRYVNLYREKTRNIGLQTMTWSRC